ncbi:MAG TPA: hypothetical protein VIC26_12060 [Marinagarivorans sp.]
MSSNTKERLLSDLEALRHQLAEIEAYGNGDSVEAATVVAIPTLEVDNIPLLGDAVPADRDEAIAAHHEAMAKLDAELRELDNAQTATNDEAEPAAQVPPSNGVSETPSASIAEAQTHAPQPSSAGSQHVEDLAAVAVNAAMQQIGAAPQHPTNTLHPHLKAYTTPMATTPNTDDNPFLPQHLRERLSKSKTSLLEEIARSSESLDASTAMLRSFASDPAKAQAAAAVVSTPDNYQALVDMLVAKYLPLIEADLRQRLSTSLQQQAAAAKAGTLEPSH